MTCRQPGLDARLLERVGIGQACVEELVDAHDAAKRHGIEEREEVLPQCRRESGQRCLEPFRGGFVVWGPGALGSRPMIAIRGEDRV